MPFHTVITSNYNYRSFLQRMSDSVIGQTDQDFEWIIVDDGSSDGSADELRALEKRDPNRVKVIVQHNQGQAAAFNAAFLKASGELVSFLDSDDWWHPEKLAWLRSSSSNREYAVFQHNLELHNGTESLGRQFRGELNSGDYFQRVLEANRRSFFLPQFSPTTGLSFRRSALDKVFPIPEVFRTCADGYLTRTAFCHGKVYSSMRIYGYYRSHGENAVLSSSQHQSDHYVRNELVPQLNTYYRRMGIPLFFDLRYFDETMRGPLSWLQRKVTEQVVVAPDYGLRRIFPLERVTQRLKPRRILVIRSDRNVEAPSELRKALADAKIDWLVSKSAPALYRDSTFIDEFIELPNEGNIDVRTLPMVFLKNLKDRNYEMVLYTCVNHGIRKNVRLLCRALAKNWFGYQGRGYIYLEGWDSLRLRRILKTS